MRVCRNTKSDRLCQIHGTPDKPANHTHRECWVFKQADKLNAEHKGRETPSEDEDEPRQPSTGGQKKFPREVKTVNMVQATHTPMRRHERVHRDTHWMSYTITFDHMDCPTGVQRGGSEALVLNPIIYGYHLTHVLMDGAAVSI